MLIGTAHRYGSLTCTIITLPSFLGFHIGLSIRRKVGNMDGSLLHAILRGWFLNTKISKKKSSNKYAP
jgi:hypothetical protein